MLNSKTLLSILLPILILLSGCQNILEGDVLIDDVPHMETQPVSPPENYAIASTYDELTEVMISLIRNHEYSGMIIVQNYDGDVQEDLDRAAHEVFHLDPLVGYSVAVISTDVSRIASQFEVEISIDYKRSRQQIDSIVTVMSYRELRAELLAAMSEYRDELVIRTSIRDITVESLINLTRETYYNNPLSIVIMPITAIEAFSALGNDYIFEFNFGHIYQVNILTENTTSLVGSVRRNAEAAYGENRAEILLSLVETLVAACIFDEEQARTISEHGAQNFAATAFGALVTGGAVGEGFAMAYKALADELGIDCRVVLGQMDGMIHAWNIVSVDGNYYHVDVSMSARNGPETAFLKNDEDIKEAYTWDRGNTVRCLGDLTYWDVVGTETSLTEPTPEELELEP